MDLAESILEDTFGTRRCRGLLVKWSPDPNGGPQPARLPLERLHEQCPHLRDVPLERLHPPPLRRHRRGHHPPPRPPADHEPAPPPPAEGVPEHKTHQRRARPPRP